MTDEIRLVLGLQFKAEERSAIQAELQLIQYSITCSSSKSVNYITGREGAASRVLG